MFFVWSKCVNARILLIWSFFDKMSIMEFLMKYNYGVSDKIIPTMNKMIKAIKYNVNIAIVDKLFYMWITYFIELICILSIILCLYNCESVAIQVSK